MKTLGDQNQYWSVVMTVITGGLETGIVLVQKQAVDGCVRRRRSDYPTTTLRVVLAAIVDFSRSRSEVMLCRLQKR